MDVSEQFLAIDPWRDADGVKIRLNAPGTWVSRTKLQCVHVEDTDASSDIFDLAIGLADKPSM